MPVPLGVGASRGEFLIRERRRADDKGNRNRRAPHDGERVEQWKYEPYTLNGGTVEVGTTVELTFPD